MAAQPLYITLIGKAEIPYPAERASVNVLVTSSGTSKAAVSDEVITTTQHIEAILSKYGPRDDSPEAKEAAPLAHWSKTSLSSTSWIPHGWGPSERPRQYQANVRFDIRFRDFKALGAFSTKLTTVEHVELQNITWMLTPQTEKACRAQLRREAARDARQKAHDYYEVLGCVNIKPVELREGKMSSDAWTIGLHVGGFTPSVFGAPPGGLFGYSASNNNNTSSAFGGQSCSLFGNSASNSGKSPGPAMTSQSLFGSSANNHGNSGSLFGTVQRNNGNSSELGATSGSLFGNCTQNNGNPGGLFGNVASNGNSGGLFANVANNGGNSSGFGAGSGGLFGSSTNNNGAGGSLFGRSTGIQQACGQVQPIPSGVPPQQATQPKQYFDLRIENDLEFEPQEVNMSMEVSIKLLLRDKA